jgi:hypothetical protein
MKPICVPCQRFFRCKQNGFYFIEAMPVNGTRPLPGTSEPEHWIPYKVWAGDRWECEGCGAVIVSGVGNGPIAEHYQPNFAENIEHFGAQQLQVNDC